MVNQGDITSLRATEELRGGPLYNKCRIWKVLDMGHQLSGPSAIMWDGVWSAELGKGENKCQEGGAGISKPC